MAERWHELGEDEKAKGLFAEGMRLDKDIPSRRALFAARLAHVDLPAALAIAREFPAKRGTGGYSANRVFWNIAQHLAAENPAEAERVLRSVPQEQGRLWLPLAVAWKMATTDPARAWRLVDEAQRFDDHPEAYLFLALGLKARDPAAADAAFQKGIEGIDRLMKEGVEYSAMTRGSQRVVAARRADRPGPRPRGLLAGRRHCARRSAIRVCVATDFSSSWSCFWVGTIATSQRRDSSRFASRWSRLTTWIRLGVRSSFRAGRFLIPALPWPASSRCRSRLTLVRTPPGSSWP